MVEVNPHHALFAKRLKGLQRGKHTNTVPVGNLEGVEFFQTKKGEGSEQPN